MAITRNDLLSGSSTADSATYTTASFTPTGNRLLVAVCSTCKSSANPNAGTISADTFGFSWSKIVDKVFNSTSGAWIALFACITPSSPGSGTVTFKPDSVGSSSASLAAWSIFEFDGADISGTVANAFAQSSTPATGTSTTPSVGLSAFADATNNLCLGAVATSQFNTTPASVTEGSGFTEIHEINVNQGAFQVDQSLQTEAKTGEDTTVDWSLSASSEWAAIAVEIKIASSGISGTIAATMQAATASLTGGVEQTGTIAAAMQAATAAMSGSASSDATGTLAGTMQAATALMSGPISVTGVVAASIQQLTAALSGTVTPFSGTMAATLRMLEASLTGHLTIDGSMAATMQAATAALAGDIEVTAALAATMQYATAEMAGTLTVAGAIAVTMQALTMSASGDIAVSGAIAATLQALTYSGVGVETFIGVMSAVMQALTFAGTSALVIPPIGWPQSLLPPNSRLPASTLPRLSPPSSRQLAAAPASRVTPPDSRL